MRIIKKKINVYLTKTELSSYNYFFLKYVFSKLKKKINLVIISTNYPGKKFYKENTNFYKKIKWINKDKLYTWSDLNLECPDIFFQSGWTVKPFNYFGKISKQINKNCQIILTADNSLQKNNLRQYLGKFYFRIYLKNKFNYVWVPGISGKELMLNFGMDERNIFTGLYSSMIDIYKNKTPTCKRKKQIIYVGQFIKRKNVKKLIKAFDIIDINKRKDWKLLLVGGGKLNLKKNKNVIILPYTLPSKLSKLYNQSLIFIIPSLRDHWPLVVHEASLSGCFLLLSSNVGNKDEFAGKSNSYIFNPSSTLAIKNALESAMSLSLREFSIASKQSEILGKKNNYKNSLNKFKKIISKCLKKK
jgi:glycosyltransferase involved in cell wall biosynthesis